ncbi:unnamed protein product, partial [Angiostrongylus costaricensis]|uniref:Secreted protein n=1 Tax=Angiostrongylus costaricensis TaxID=334426 RepID=A0A0R3PTJ9_ANGCS
RFPLYSVLSSVRVYYFVGAFATHHSCGRRGVRGCGTVAFFLPQVVLTLDESRKTRSFQ